MRTNVCGKMLGGFANVTGITARIQKFVKKTRTDPTSLGKGSFTPTIAPCKFKTVVTHCHLFFNYSVRVFSFLISICMYLL